MFDCNIYGNEQIYVLEQDGTWTAHVETAYDGFCADANPMPWNYNGVQVQRIVCAVP